MPYCKITTNISPGEAACEELLRKASTSVAAVLGKPEQYVMVAVETGGRMLFAGSDEPCVFIDLRSIGLPESKTKPLSKELCAVCKETIGVKSDRVYIAFQSAAGAMWGWNGGTF